MRLRTVPARTPLISVCVVAALGVALPFAGPSQAAQQAEQATVIRTPPTVNEGPWRAEYYYLDPRPEAMFESLLAALSKEQMLPEDRYATIVMLGMLLEQHPERTAEWAQALGSIPDQNQSAVWNAMAGASTDECVMALTAIKQANEGVAPTIDYLIKTPPRDIISEQFTSPNRLTELWAAYFMSGDPIYVRRIIQALEWATPEEEDQMRTLIGGGAYWSLVRNCHMHSKVLETCRSELKSAEGRIERSLKAVLHEAEAKLTTEPCPEPKPPAKAPGAKD